jgi:DNA-binding response OmpR family regulator
VARILVAEDEPHIFRMVDFKLKALGHEVICATDGGEAMEAATTQKPDLILLDVMMPVMDGFQVLKKLKANLDTKGIPVIMLTAKSQERDVVTGLESGAEDYVVKPFSFPELLARINGALEHKR